MTVSTLVGKKITIKENFFPLLCFFKIISTLKPLTLKNSEYLHLIGKMGALSIQLTLFCKMVIPWYLNGLLNSITWALSGFIVSGATIKSAFSWTSWPINPFHSYNKVATLNASKCQQLISEIKYCCLYLTNCIFNTSTNLFSSIIVSFQAAIFIERHMKAVSKIAFLSQQFQQVDAVSFATGLLFSCKKSYKLLRDVYVLHNKYIKQCCQLEIIHDWKWDCRGLVSCHKKEVVNLQKE